MNYTAEDRALALAGVFQVGALVADVAHGRSVDEQAYRSSLESLFVETPEAVADVFGGPRGVRLGLLLMRDALASDRQRSHAEVLRYALNIVHVERRFAGQPALQAKLETRMKRVKEQLQHFDIGHTTIIGALASAYQDTLSTLPQRIQVVGNAQALQEERNAERIRALLLAGVRSALLWYQVGGRRWRLVFSRRTVQAAASRLTDQLSAH
ncbi:MAG: high frequency lysogenization protein HflD [Gammaproteobacteria bacterium]|nr:high frequency lysogenization protein HflD [Gammaproteobacteria bacterium]